MDEQGLFSEVLAALLATQPDEKIQSVEWLGREWTNGRLDRPKKPPTTLLTKSATTKSAPIKIEHPGRPEKPLLVHHRDLDKRKLSTPAGRAALIHAIAHIEFNAINLALDAVYRFREMPERIILIGCLWQWMNRGISGFWRLVLRSLVINTAIFPPIMVCGIWRFKPTTMFCTECPWCPVCSRPGGWMSHRP